VFKRLISFIDHNDLKPDIIDLINSIYSNHGYEAIEMSIVTMTVHQLEQLKDKVPEVRKLLEDREAERERKKEHMMEEKKRIDVEPARNALNK
jgi:hypothetical protein